MSSFSLRIKPNLFGSGQKVPVSKVGHGLIYCGSKESSGWVSAHLYFTIQFPFIIFLLDPTVVKFGITHPTKIFPVSVQKIWIKAVLATYLLDGFSPRSLGNTLDARLGSSRLNLLGIRKIFHKKLIFPFLSHLVKKIFSTLGQKIPGIDPYLLCVRRTDILDIDGALIK